MTVYDFILRFKVGDADTDPAQYFEALGNAGCTDALVGVGQMGAISLDFGREAPSARDGVESAIVDVKSAIPDAELVEVSPDLVGLTELAEYFGFSRQYMRKLAYSHAGSFPSPVHEGKPSMWHLATVLEWADTQRGMAVNQQLTEISKVAMTVNAAIGTKSADPDEVEKLRALIA